MVTQPDFSLRYLILLVALLNLAYFGIEFSVALVIGSVSLFADSVGFLRDASVNALIFFAMVWSARSCARVGAVLAIILLVPGLATLWMAFDQFLDPVPPQPFALSLTGLGALAINVACAIMLAAYRQDDGSLTKAAFLSARSGALANMGLIAAGFVTAFLWRSAWPDLIVGSAIVAMNADAVREVWLARDDVVRGAFRPPQGIP